MFGSVRERLSRYEEAPSAGLWEKIASQPREKERAWPVWVEAVSLVGMAVMLYSLNTGTVEKEVVKAPAAIENNISEPGPVAEVVERKIVLESRKEEVVSSYREAPIAGSEFIQTETGKAEIVTGEIADTEIAPGEDLQADSVYSPVILKIEETADEVVPPYKKPKSKFQFYLSLTPSLSFQKIIPSGNDALIVQGFENRSPLSMKRFGFGIDAGFQRDINNIFGFYGGLSFYRQNQQSTYFYYDKDADVTRVGDSWTFEITRQQHSKTFEYTMTNVGASAGLLVTLKGDKLKHKFGAGLLFSQGLAKGTDSYNNSRSNYLSYQVFYRNEIRVNDHFSWFVEPTFIYSFISKEKLAEPFVLKPYRAGIRAGVLYRFQGK